MKKLIFILIIAMALIDMVYSQSITVTAPGGGTPWYRGQSNDITWTQSGSMDTHVKIYLMKGSQYLDCTCIGYTGKLFNQGPNG